MSVVQTVGFGLLSALQDGGETRTELDSHADTCVVGKNALVVHDFDRVVNVTGYDPNQAAAQSLRIVSAALAYDDPRSGEVIILVLHQAISIPHLDHNFVSPFQMRLNDVKVNDTPRFLTEKPSETTHTLIVPGAFGTDDELVIPLGVFGVSSVFPTRKPTVQEYESCIRRYDLTYEAPDFDPSDPSFARAEEAMMDSFGGLRDTRGDSTTRVRSLCQMSRVRASNSLQDDSSEFLLAAVSNTLSERTFLTAMIANVHVSGTGTSNCQVSGVTTSDRRNGVDAPTLARNWGIGLEAAKKTIKVTTQRGVRTMVHPSLSRRFRTNDRQLRYRRLGIECFTDTLIAKTESRQKNKYAQVFCTVEGWTRAFPMKLKSEAHEALSLLHRRDGFPNVMIMDNAKEQVNGDFRRKNREVHTHVSQTEAFSPWMNAAEGAIKELKKGHGRDMVRERSPKVLWDHCLERQGHIRSLTAHTIYGLDG